MNKVCVYAILKNEISNIYKWFLCVKEADLICFLDTGSTDGGLDLLNQLQATNSNIRVKSTSYEKFSFGEARNDSLIFAKEEISKVDPAANWIFITLDLDEFLAENGINVIRSSWDNSCDSMCLICSNSRQEVNHKIHSNDNWVWKRSIHETIRLQGRRTSELKIQLAVTSYVHNQVEKERDYFDMLLDSYEKDPLDITTASYLSWEYYNRQDWENFFKFNLLEISLIFSNTEDDYYLDYQYLAACYLNIIEYYKHFSRYGIIDRYLDLLENLVNEGRAPYFRRIKYERAVNYFNKHESDTGIKLLVECLDHPVAVGYWVDNLVWDDAICEKLVLRYYYDIKDFGEAYRYAKRAYELNPSKTNEMNLESCKLTVEMQEIADKYKTGESE